MPARSLSILNSNPKFFEGPQLLHNLIKGHENWAAIAVDFLGEGGQRRQLSYRELHTLSDSFSQAIRTHLKSSRSQQCIPVLISQSPELYVALLGILKAGCCFCPLSLDAPRARLRFILEDVGSSLVVTSSTLRRQLPSLDNVHVICADDFPHPSLQNEYRQDRQSETLSPHSTYAVSSGDLAYIMYTSGSSGLPKGVGISHLSVTQSLLAHDTHMPIFSRFLQFAATTFDVSVFEIFFPLFRGASVVSCHRPFMLGNLPEVINSMDVDAVELTPTVVGSLLPDRKSVPKLRLLLTIGEMLTDHIVETFGNHGSDDDGILWGMYGPTECSIHCTVQPRFSSQSSVNNIGAPLESVSAFVIEPLESKSSPPGNVRILPVGEVGELAVGGHQLATGYINNPDQNDISFVESESFGRLYRTGDMAKMLPDGSIRCLGRITSGQVKLRGQRIELEEIEQIACKSTHCRSAVASVVDDILVLFCLSHESEVTYKSTKSICKEWLPSFMIPGDIMCLEEFPHTASGKIDRKRLEETYLMRMKRQENESQPIATENDVVKEVLSRVLHRKVLDSNTFGSLGVDSLTAIRVASELQKLGIRLSAADILSSTDLQSLREVLKYKNSTNRSRANDKYRFEELCKKLKAKLMEGKSLVSSEVVKFSVAPCTPLQEAIVGEMLASTSSYCNWVEIDLGDCYGYEIVKQCILELVSHEEILRTGIVDIKSNEYSFAQIIWDSFDEDNIACVQEFRKLYNVRSTDELLQPFRVQVLCSSESTLVLLQLPHFLYDGWSVGLIVDDLSCLLQDREVKHKAQFRDVSRLYFEHQDGAESEEARNYWSQEMLAAGVARFPNLSSQRGLPPAFHSLRHNSRIKLSDLERSNSDRKVKPQVFFQAALLVLLSLYTDSPEVMVGSVTSGRTIPVAGIESVVGPCIATLPLTVKIDRTQSVESLLWSIHEKNKHITRYCTFPLKQIKRMYGSSPNAPLFDILFVWQQGLQDNVKAVNEVRVIDSGDFLEYKITLEIEPRHDELLVRANYDSSTISEEHLRTLLYQLDALCVGMLNPLSSTINDALDSLEEPELSVANPRPLREEPVDNLAKSVESWAQKAPDKTAVIFSSFLHHQRVESCLSYSELNARSNRLAWWLLAMGVEPDHLVCILMEKSLDLYVTILATAKVGAGYLPITPETPADRVRWIVNQARPKICLTDDLKMPNFRFENETSFHCVQRISLKSYSIRDLGILSAGSNISYAVFTSGSTGTPKGVLVTQHNLMSNLRVLSDLYPVTDESRLLQACSQAFDVSVFEIFFAWHVGITLCSAKKDDLFQDLEGEVNRLKISHLSLTPTVAALIDPTNVPKVEFLVTAGEALTETVRQKWAKRELFQGYGPSETTNICTVKPKVRLADHINDIGLPLKNTSAFVMETDCSRILPKGAVGELCFGGEQVFRGYLNMPDLTSAKIIDHPIFGRLYRSGDMGRMLSSGSLHFTGRNDEQVKIRGQRVELGEITSLLLMNGSISECSALLTKSLNDANSQQLVVFWVPSCFKETAFRVVERSKRHLVEVSRMFELLSSKLPAYMVPTYMIPISSVPRTQQSKIDRRLLIRSFEDLSNDEREVWSENTNDDLESEVWLDIDRKISRALSETLRIPKESIKKTTSFFGLGMDSISAIRFSKALESAGFPLLPISTILQNSTISLLSKAVKDKSLPIYVKNDLTPSQRAIEPETQATVQRNLALTGYTIEKILPPLPLQEAMISATATGDSSKYTNWMLFEVQGDESRLRQAWHYVYTRQEILRTIFEPLHDPNFTVAQVVTEAKELPWSVRQVPEVDKKSFIATSIDELGQSLYAPGKLPWQLTFIKSTSQNYLLFCCHHSLYDGTAIELLLKEVEAEYHGRSLSRPVPIEPFSNYVCSVNSNESFGFWKTLFSDFEPTSFPDLTGRAASCANRKPAYRVRSSVLEVSLEDSLAACRENSATLLSALQTAWAKLLDSYQDTNDVCFGNIFSGRTAPVNEIESLVAPCFNSLPIRIKLGKGARNIDLMMTLQSLNSDILSYQFTPLRRIQSQLGLEGKRLFDSLLIFQQGERDLDSEVWKLQEEYGEMDLPLALEITPNSAENQLSVQLHYCTSIVLEDEASKILESFSASFKSCIFEPQARSGSIIEFLHDVGPEIDESRKKGVPVNSTLLHSAFEENATLYPDRIALSFLGKDGSQEDWTYRSLNSFANRISSSLLQNGVSLESAIPISMPKCPAFYASVLGVLKSGAAFTPLDPSLPDARKQFMVQELGASRVLTSSGVDLSWCPNILAINVCDIDHRNDENPILPHLSASNLAYRLYTSGSTGKPKAVSVEHHSPIQTVKCSKELLPWKISSRMLQFASITFDMCYFDCFLAWSCGFTICAAEQISMVNDVPGIANALNVDILDLTPSIAADITPKMIPSVKCLYCIGERLQPKIVDQWEGKCVNSYGPTEAAFCCTIFPARKDINSSVIGRPFPETSFTVLSRGGLFDVPILGIGELHISGSQVARGYHGNDELTKERFINRNGERLYKTGDIVRTLADGSYEYIGRTDEQVKIRGLRVELQEITHVIKSHGAVQDATVLILRASDGGKDQLVAFIMSDNSSQKSQSEILDSVKDEVSAQLPFYMAPTFYIFVQSIPLSAAGKVDKRKLRETFITEFNDETKALEADDDSSSWNEVESTIRDTLSQLSKTPPPRILKKTTIYQLGLDSVSAVQLAAALRKQSFQISASDVLERPTCEALARHILTNSGQKLASQVTFDFLSFESMHKDSILKAHEVNPSEVSSIRPCTAMQIGLLTKFIESDAQQYYNYLKLRVAAQVDEATIRRAFGALTRKYSMLRTGFAQIQGSQHSFAMIIYQIGSLQLPEENKTGLRVGDSTAREWLRSSGKDVCQNLHRPPWRFQLAEEEGQISIHLAIHHSLYDARSLHVLMRDLERSCKAQDIGSPQSIDRTLSAILEASKMSKDVEEYWKKRKSDFAIHRFPNLLPLQTGDTLFEVQSISCSLSFKTLQSFCRHENISVQALGEVAWARLLSDYLGEDKVTFGVVYSGQTILESAEDAFPSISTVPFNTTLQSNNREMLMRVMEENTLAQRYQYTPLADIQQLIGHAGSALFDTLFAYQKNTSDNKNENFFEVVHESASVDYTISMEILPHSDDVLKFQLTYTTGVLPRQQASILLDQFDSVLKNIVTNESEFDTVDGNDSQLYSMTPAKEDEIPSTIKLLHEFVENTAQRHPDRIALEFATEVHQGDIVSNSWSYRELNGIGNQVAHELISQGAKSGSLIAICFDKCAEASFAILGILKSGCAYVALDPSAPVDRKTFITNDSQASMIISMSELSEHFKTSVGVPVIDMDKLDRLKHPDTKPTLQFPTNPQDRSYCLYTSGTTGIPKGCEITHENAVQALLSFQRLFAGHWNKDSRWLQFASFHFDVSVLEQYWSWSVGITVVSAPRDTIFEDLAETIRRLQITHIDLTPSLARLLHPDEVPSLCKGVFITGGEQLKQEILDVWGPKLVIYNGYGPTEATIGVTMYPRVPANGKSSNIGYQFDNVGTLVLKPSTDIPVLRGGLGELCVSGKLVGRGYLNRPELTEKSFPYLSRFHERIYRTGDLVRILHDGSFSFLGRADDQVKLRGQRLEIGEINAIAKQSSEAVADVATVVLKHAKQEKEHLVTFVTENQSVAKEQDPNVLLDEGSLSKVVKDACRAKLPGYMVPTHVLHLSSIPLSINHKADVRHLKQIYDDLSPVELQKLGGNTSQPPKKLTDKEEKIVDILSSLVTSDSRDALWSQSFFEMGFDSINILEFSRRLREVGFQNAHSSLILKNATVRSLADAIESSNSGELDASFANAQQYIFACQHKYNALVRDVGGRKPYKLESISPCTPLQQGIISRSADSSKGLYYNSFRYELSSSCNIDKLRTEWHQLYKTTEILRSCFISTEEGHVMAIFKDTPLPWKETSMSDDNDLESFFDSNRKEWILCNEVELLRPFQLILARGSTKNYLAIHIHHSLYDGISFSMTLQRVLKGLRGARSIDHGPSFVKALPFGPLRKLPGEKEFWRAHLNRSVVIKMPRISSQPSAQDSLTSQSFSPPNIYSSTRRTLNVTDQAVAQACWLATIKEMVATVPIIGLVLSGRNMDLDGADKIVGPLFNTVPFSMQVDENDTWSSLARRCHNFNLSVLQYQHTPLRDILKWVNRTGEKSLFDILFVFQRTSEDADDVSRNEFWKEEYSDARADYPLSFEAEQDADGKWKLTISAQGHISDDKSSMELLEKFKSCMVAFVENPESKVKDHLKISGDFNTITEIIELGEINALERRPDESSSGNIEGFRWTGETRKIRESLADLSGTDFSDIHATTSIFGLGLDSIDAIKLSAKLKKQQIRLSTSAIMKSQTIMNMADFIDRPKEQIIQPKDDLRLRVKRLKASLSNSKYMTKSTVRVLPSTPLQESMVAEMLSSGYERYFNHDILKLKSSTNIDRLKDAWERVIENTPILRTEFHHVDDPNLEDSFAQIEHTYQQQTWSTEEITSENQFHGILEKISSQARLNTSKITAFQLTIVSSQEANYMVLSIAHALYDGWSLGLLHDDVRDSYHGTYTPRQDYEPILGHILNTSEKSSEKFWPGYLSDAKRSCVKNIKAKAVSSSTTVHRAERVGQVPSSDAQAFCRAQNVSLQVLGQLCWAVVLASYVGQLDVSFAEVLSGRDDELASNAIFPTMNTVPIRIILHGTFKDMLKYLQDNMISIRSYQHTPLRAIQSAIGFRVSDLLNSLFIFQRRPESRSSGNPSLYQSLEGSAHVEYPICVEFEVTGEETIWRCACESSVFGASEAETLLLQLSNVFESIVQNPDEKVVESSSTGLKICRIPILHPSVSQERESAADDNTEYGEESAMWSESEGVIRSIISAVSKTPEDKISKDMTLFHLGLDSISLLKVSSLLRKNSLAISVSTMLDSPTIKGMAQLAKRPRVNGTSTDQERSKNILTKLVRDINRTGLLKKLNIKEDDVVEILPATSGQTYMLSVWEYSGRTLFYPEFSYNLKTAVSAAILQEAWQKLVSRYSILRTCFFATGNRYVPIAQVVLRKVRRSCVIIKDVEGKLDSPEEQPYVQLVAQGCDFGWRLRLHIHHALYDATSLQALMEELGNLCIDEIRPDSSDEVFTKFLASTMAEEAMKKKSKFWKSYLNEAQTPELAQPNTSPYNRMELFRPKYMSGISELVQSSRNRGIGIQSVFLSVFARALAAQSSNSYQYDSIVIGLYLANRSHSIEGLPDAVIPTLNLVPLKVNVSLSILDSAEAIQADLRHIGSLENSSVALWQIDEWTGVRLNSFVNLRLFTDSDGEEDDNRRIESIVEEDNTSLGTGWSRVVKPDSNRAQAASMAAGKDVQDSYLHAVDIEATFKDGQLDVGLFAPEEIFDLDMAEKFLQSVRAEIKGLLQS